MAEREQTRLWRGKKRPRTQDTFPWLDKHFKDDARAGVPDKEISRQSGISVPMVIRWRRSRGIHRKDHTLGEETRAVAVSLLGKHHGDVLHRVGDSAVGGRWTPPEYVLRRPLNYSELARHLYFLDIKMGTGYGELAGAFGIREDDVRVAIEVYEAYIEREGHECASCGLLIPKKDTYCSRECEERGL